RPAAASRAERRGIFLRSWPWVHCSVASPRANARSTLCEWVRRRTPPAGGPLLLVLLGVVRRGRALFRRGLLCQRGVGARDQEGADGGGVLRLQHFVEGGHAAFAERAAEHHLVEAFLGVQQRRAQQVREGAAADAIVAVAQLAAASVSVSAPRRQLRCIHCRVRL